MREDPRIPLFPCDPIVKEWARTNDTVISIIGHLNQGKRGYAKTFLETLRKWYIDDQTMHLCEDAKGQESCLETIASFDLRLESCEVQETCARFLCALLEWEPYAPRKKSVPQRPPNTGKHDLEYDPRFPKWYENYLEFSRNHVY